MVPLYSSGGMEVVGKGQDLENGGGEAEEETLSGVG